MNKISALLSVSFALSACGAIPPSADRVQEGLRGDAIEATEVRSAADGPGLGIIDNRGNTRTQPCKRQRRTGSHLYRSGCEDPDSGSQPVRFGGWHDLGRYAMSGSVRPEN